jgi:hypothetical protein
MMQPARSPARLAFLVTAAGSLAGCSQDPVSIPIVASDPGVTIPTSTGVSSVAFGRWTPGPNDTCTQAQHDAFQTIGPDGKLYPTWHPPDDPATGCTFGHDHGRDPSGSALFAAVGPIPFGYANEQLDTWDPASPRHEDHVGHKVEWEDNFEATPGGAAGELLATRCSMLTKLHQGTHSRDAFTNNLHELVYHIACTDGTEIHMTMMTAIGKAGEFVASCDRDRHVFVGTPNPANSPDGGGKRIIPDRQCVEEEILVPDGERSSFGSLRESWEVSARIRQDGGGTLASINPYYQVFFPSRFHDPALADVTGRPIAVCYETEPNGDTADDGACEESTNSGSLAGLTFDDPRSAFNGVQRAVDINSNNVRNAEGPAVWYSDPFGDHAQTEAFPGSIRQYIARMDNGGVDPGGKTFGRDREYGSSGTHAPN